MRRKYALVTGTDYGVGRADSSAQRNQHSEQGRSEENDRREIHASSAEGGASVQSAEAGSYGRLRGFCAG